MCEIEMIQLEKDFVWIQCISIEFKIQADNNIADKYMRQWLQFQ